MDEMTEALLTFTFFQIEENTRVLEKLGQRGSTAPGYASRWHLTDLVLCSLCIVVYFIKSWSLFRRHCVMLMISALMTIGLCVRAASAGRPRKDGRLAPRRLCFSGSRLRLGTRKSKFEKKYSKSFTQTFQLRWASSLECRSTTLAPAGGTAMLSWRSSTALDLVIIFS